MWDLIVSVPDHCLPFYLLQVIQIWGFSPVWVRLCTRNEEGCLYDL